MKKIIAVCGSPSSGKTTLGLKIAQELYFTTNAHVLFVSPDNNTPALSYIFPRRKDNELFSLGVVLDKTTITGDDVLKQTVYSGESKNFGYLGLKTGENRYSYPRPTEDKIHEFFNACKSVADFIFIDCSANFDDLISRMAMREADTNIQLITPDLRSMGYYSSYDELYKSVSDKVIKVININDKDLFLPTEEVRSHFGGVDFKVPYSLPLKQQAITGTLSEKINDTRFRQVCKDIARTVANR